VLRSVEPISSEYPAVTALWPSPQPSWCDPPWRMSGRSVTGWFSVSWEQVELLLPEELRPPKTLQVTARLRFYDISYHAAQHANPEPLDSCGGSFREAALALGAAYRGVPGEVSIFMWSDSGNYTNWGREAFGWPVRRGALALSGPMWEPGPIGVPNGSCRVSEVFGSAALFAEGEELTGDDISRSSNQCWLTPRRTLLRAGLDGEQREVLAVSPNVSRPGKRQSTTGHMALDFATSHPLHCLGSQVVEVEIIDDFEIVVGDKVTRL